MPHTNRKKKPSKSSSQTEPFAKKFVHSRREFIDDADGWTQVADKGWKSARSNREQDADVTPSIDMTLEKMIKEHERYRKQWESSSAAADLAGLLQRHGDSGKVKVENTICLALGSLQALSLDWRRSSHTQLAALTAIKETLDLGGQCVMQDPRFTELDRKFLTSMGYEVVSNPDAFLRLDQASLVYAIHSPIDLFSRFKPHALPAVVIGNDFRNSLFNGSEISRHDLFDNSAKEGGEVTEETTQCIAEQLEEYPKILEDNLTLIENCEEIGFPQLRYDFSDTKIYWRYLQNLDTGSDSKTPGNVEEGQPV